MTFRYTSINSGSNGNCYYLGNEKEGILIDAGISCDAIVNRLKQLDVGIETIKGIFVSHEHIDHIRGIKSIATKYRIPVFINEATLNASSLSIDNRLINNIKADEAVTLDNISITCFNKEHDAASPVSFIIQYDKITAGVFTDIGYCCKNVINYVKKCHILFLEANYDEEMLANSNYPHFLKERIRSNRGHLSNKQAFNLLYKHKPKKLKKVILSHLSENNNCPFKVMQLFQQLKGTAIKIASRNHALPMMYFDNTDTISGQQLPLF